LGPKNKKGKEKLRSDSLRDGVGKRGRERDNEMGSLSPMGGVVEKGGCRRARRVRTEMLIGHEGGGGEGEIDRQLYWLIIEREAKAGRPGEEK